MIHIVGHEGLNGNFLRICKWVRQFGEWQLIEMNQLPSLADGIVLLIDLPIRPSSGYRVRYPVTEPGQTEATHLKEYFIENTSIPIVSFGSFSLAEMFGVSLERQSSKNRTRQLLGKYEEVQYWFKGVFTETPEKGDYEILSSYISREGKVVAPLALKHKNMYCCNTQPYKFENVEGSHYKKAHGYSLGDPISNLILKKILQL